MLLAQSQVAVTGYSLFPEMMLKKWSFRWKHAYLIV